MVNVSCKEMGYQGLGACVKKRVLWVWRSQRREDSWSLAVWKALLLESIAFGEEVVVGVDRTTDWKA